MDDFDKLNSKTDSELRQIAVAFGDFLPEEAEKKTRDELIMAITGAKDIGDVTVVDLAEDPVPVKSVAIPEQKVTEHRKSLDELIVDVGRTARFETNDLADAMLKSDKKEEKKVAKKETVTEEQSVESKDTLQEDTKPAKKTTRTTKKTKAKAEEVKAEEVKAETKKESVVAEEASGSEDKPAKRTTSRKTRGSKKADAQAEENKTSETTPVEALAAEANASPKVSKAGKKTAKKAEKSEKTEKTENETAPAEAQSESQTQTETQSETVAAESISEEKKQGDVVQGRHGRSKRRKITFGYADTHRSSADHPRVCRRRGARSVHFLRDREEEGKDRGRQRDRKRTGTGRQDHQRSTQAGRNQKEGSSARSQGGNPQDEK